MVDVNAALVTVSIGGLGLFILLAADPIPGNEVIVPIIVALGALVIVARGGMFSWADLEISAVE